jgi:hypothetical protein
MGLTISTSRLDSAAMALSGLCLVHCLATAVLLALLSAAGGVLGSHVIHEVGLTLAMGLGAVALGRGILEHGFMMPRRCIPWSAWQFWRSATASTRLRQTSFHPRRSALR